MNYFQDRIFMHPLRCSLVVILLILFSLSGNAQNLFYDSKIHEIRITFDTPEWHDILSRYYDESNHTDDKKMLNATFSFDGHLLESPIVIRFKGQYSYFGFPGKKKPFRLNIGKVDKNQNLNGTKKFNLHNLAGDPSFLREYIAYDFLRYQDIPASRTSFTKLYVNDAYFGCYLIVEEPEDDAFLIANFGSKSGNLFEADTTTDLKWKGNNADDYPEIKLQTKANKNSWNQFINWLDIFNNYYGIDFSNHLNNIFETDAFFKIMAADIFMDNWDNYAANGRNFFVYEDPKTTKMNWVPWDYNLSFWEKNLPLFPKNPNGQFKPIIWRVYSNPYLQRKYLEAACKLANYAAAQYPLAAKIRKQQQLIATAIQADPHKFYSFEAFQKNSDEAVTVTMLRGGVNKEIYLPGLISHWAKRKNSIRKEAASMHCDCDEIVEDGQQPGHFYIQLYPNPVNDILNIYTDLQLEDLTYSIYNIAGQLIHTATALLNNGNATLDISYLSTGSYMFSIYKNKHKKNFQITKQ